MLPLLSDWPRRFSLIFDRPKNTKFVEDMEYLLQVPLNSDQWFQRSRNVPANQEAKTVILVSRSTLNTKPWQKTLRSCFFLIFVKFCSAVAEKNSKVSRPIKRP